ncbi:MAG: nitrophenyl compound nitroreductase subunit ArsF family protein [Nanoarchaeota archaeon]|nr:hypothetical protein [Nanoarchaeota archaeon]MBU1632251.1 hypothetical protein [Nanoarchaeota archaeon]MBU1876058.1 hypothetical protein [Nanoarchaeota archaeon]
MKIKYSFLVLVISLIFLSGCSSNESPATGNAVFDSLVEVNVDKLEIYHFHATNQCYSCKTVGAYAEETVNTYFKDELNEGKIIFDHVNVDIYENRDLVIKYSVTGSSLWLGTYNENEFNAEENTNVWYKIKDKQDYMNYLKGVIEQKLAGN